MTTITTFDQSEPNDEDDIVERLEKLGDQIIDEKFWNPACKFDHRIVFDAAEEIRILRTVLDITEN